MKFLLRLIAIVFAPALLFAQGEYLVNTHQDTSQRDPRIMQDISGNYTIVWCSMNQASEDSDSDIYLQRFDANNNKVGVEILVNDITANSQERPSASMNAAGDYIIVWASHTGDFNSIFDIKAKLHKNDAAASAEFLVNTTTANSQTKPSAAMNSNGEFVVAWESWYQDGSNKGVYMQRYDSNGDKIGDETLVNTTTANSQGRPVVKYFPDGKFIVIWESWEQNGSSTDYDLYGKIYDAQGSVVKDEFLINTFTDSYQWFADVETMSSGEFVTVWCSWDQDGHWGGVYLQKFDPTFEKTGDEILVNTTTVNYQWLPKIRSMQDGMFAVVWSSWKQDGSREGVYAQTFDSDLNKVSFETKVNDYTDNYQWEPDFVVTGNNELLVTWSTYGQYDDFDVVAARAVPEGPEAVISASTFEHPAGNSTSRIYVHVMDSTVLTGDQYKVTFNVVDESDASATITNVNTSETEIQNFPVDKGEGVFYLTEEFDGVAVQIVPVFEFELDLDKSYFANNSGSNLTFTVGKGLGSSKLAPIDFIVVWGSTEQNADGTYVNPLDSAYNQTGQKVVMCPFYAWNVTDGEKMDLVIIEPNPTDNHRWDGSETVGFLTPPQYEPNFPQYHASLTPFHEGGEPQLPSVGDTNYIFTRRPLTSEDEFTFITENEFITTGLTEENYPVKFDLKQNYPNPFNPTTTIEYSIPAISYSNSTNIEAGQSGLMPVKLAVYNILGQKVRTLVDKELAPGHHRVQFDASGLASGVYFYNIQIGNKSISKKMLLLR